MEYLHFSPKQYNFSSFEEYLLALSLEYSLIFALENILAEEKIKHFLQIKGAKAE